MVWLDSTQTALSCISVHMPIKKQMAIYKVMRSTTLFVITKCTFNSVMHHKDKESHCTRYNLNLYFHSQFITEYLSLQNITWSHPTLFLHLLRSLITASSSWHLNLPVLCLATSHVVHYRHSSRTSLVIFLPTQYTSLVTMCFPWPQHFNFNTFTLMHSLYYCYHLFWLLLLFCGSGFSLRLGCFPDLGGMLLL